MADRIPPESEELKFVRNTKTGTVHVQPRDGSDPVDVPAGTGWGEAVAAWLAAPPPGMLCGARLRLEPWGSAEYVGTFEDEDLCAACVRLLGGQSARAFEHPRPGDRETS